MHKRAEAAMLADTGVRAPALMREVSPDKVVRGVLAVMGGAPQALVTRGPVIDEDHHGRPRALAWTAHRPEAVNMVMIELESARTLEEAMTVANRTGSPAQLLLSATVVGPDLALIKEDPEFVKRSLHRGHQVHAWTVNEPADIARVLDLRVDGVISDYPDRVQQELTRRGK